MAAVPSRDGVRPMTEPMLEIADELYALPLERFTPERDARAKAAKGDKDLVAALKALRKPSLAAWVVNLLVRREADQVEQVLAIGAALREAQEGMDGAELRALTKQRRQLTSAVTSPGPRARCRRGCPRHPGRRRRGRGDPDRRAGGPGGRAGGAQRAPGAVAEDDRGRRCRRRGRGGTAGRARASRPHPRPPRRPRRPSCTSYRGTTRRAVARRPRRRWPRPRRLPARPRRSCGPPEPPSRSSGRRASSCSRRSTSCDAGSPSASRGPRRPTTSWPRPRTPRPRPSRHTPTPPVPATPPVRPSPPSTDGHSWDSP